MALIKNINVARGAFTLSIPELKVSDSGVTAFVGPSGSGKTTFFNTLIGIHNPKDWIWDFKGQNLAQLEISERRLGVVFQNYDLFPHLSAEENIRIVFDSRCVGNFTEIVKPYIAKLQLERCWKTMAGDLSGGEKQRVALLRALISQPRILLLDEPFAALDINLRGSARQLVRELLSELQIPIYLITHDQEDVQQLAHYVVSIENGAAKIVK